jgi:DNA-binding XRE family transcriptional regulator
MKVNELKKKTNLTLKDMAEKLGVNKVTIVRWNQKGGNIPPLYDERVKALLKQTIAPTTKKKVPKKRQWVTTQNGAPKEIAKKNTDKEWDIVLDAQYLELTLVNLFHMLKNKPEVEEIRNAIGKFLTTKLKLK